MLVTSVASFAQSNGTITRSQVRAELQALEQVGSTQTFVDQRIGMTEGESCSRSDARSPLISLEESGCPKRRNRLSHRLLRY